MSRRKSEAAKKPDQSFDRPLAKSRLTRKSQATVPAAVRKRLSLSPGDILIFEEAKDGGVKIRRGEPLDLEFISALEGTLSEWNSENDDLAYRDL
jgi:AbrB family looped-hinge helix DNA binding protein